MAIVSLTEFAEMIGMSYDTAKKNAQRGKIIKGTDGKIDTDNAVNRLFLDKKKAQNINKPNPVVAQNDVSKTRKTVERPTGLTAQQKQYADIDLRTKIAAAETKEREAELKRLQLEKLAGNLLPVDQVEKIIVVNVQAILKNFRSERDNMALVMVERFGGNRKDLVEITTALDKIMDVVISKAEKDANYELDIAVSQYQEVRSRGERK
jgi:hypothetical protein